MFFEGLMETWLQTTGLEIDGGSQTSWCSASSNKWTKRTNEQIKNKQSLGSLALLHETRFWRQHQVLLQRVQSFQDHRLLLFGIHAGFTDAEEIYSASSLGDSELVCSKLGRCGNIAELPEQRQNHLKVRWPVITPNPTGRKSNKMGS